MSTPLLVHGWNRAVEQCRKEEKETIFYGGISRGIKETPRRLSREFWSAFRSWTLPMDALFSLFTMLLKSSSPNCVNCERGSLTNWIELDEQQLGDTEINEWNFYFNCCPNRFVNDFKWYLKDKLFSYVLFRFLFDFKFDYENVFFFFVYIYIYTHTFEIIKYLIIIWK